MPVAIASMSSTRALSDPDGDAGDGEGRELGHRDAHERGVDARLLGHRVQRPLGGNGHVLGVEVVASGSPQAQRRPGVLDHDVARFEHGDAHRHLGLAADGSTQFPKIHVAWRHPLANAHRPETT